MSKRQYLTPEQKIAIVQEHLLEGIPVSTIVDKHTIHDVQFYQWQKQLFEKGAVVFERKPNGHNVRRQEAAKDQKIEQLEAKIQQKNDVMAELLEEHIKLKKNLGNPKATLGNDPSAESMPKLTLLAISTHWTFGCLGRRVKDLPKPKRPATPVKKANVVGSGTA